MSMRVDYNVVQVISVKLKKKALVQKIGDNIRAPTNYFFDLAIFLSFVSFYIVLLALLSF